jgi:hypothetical protein
MMQLDVAVQTERRRRFVLVECPFCREEHDALLDGGRLKAQCGREAEAVTVDGVSQGRVWGLETEQRELRAARIL